ncbi:MAG: hypothetical protein WC341_15125 [Bacteroidales bacterium]|jgi:hypothetical protein
MEWISVDERLPVESGKKYGEEFLVFTVTKYDVGNNKYDTMFAFYSNGDFYHHYISPENKYPIHGRTVLNWMKIERPKKIKNK